MTNPTPHGQVPEALRLADWLQAAVQIFPQRSEDDPGGYASEVDQIMDEAAAELRRLHAYCQELESQVILDCMTHVQKPAEIEHVAGDVLKNGAEVNMNVYAELPQSVGDHKYGGGLYTDAQMHAFADATHALRTQQPAPATQQAVGNSGFDHKTAADFLSGKTVSDEALRKFVAASRGAHDDRAALRAQMLALRGVLASREAEIALLKRSLLDAEAAAPQSSPTAQADSQPAPVQSGLVATMLAALRHAQKVLNHNNLHMDCGPINAAILAARDPADSVTAPHSEPWYGHQFKEVRRGYWQCSCGKAIAEAVPSASKDSYPPLPNRYAYDDDGGEMFTADHMRAYADETYALRIGAKHA